MRLTTGRIAATERMRTDGSTGPRRVGCAALRPRDTGRAFTLVEMLIVIAVVIVLLSILIVGLSKATQSAQKANTVALMNAIAQGLVRFKADLGYYPPVLGRDTPVPTNQQNLLRTYRAAPDPDDADYADDVQDWSSVTSLADFLIGYGNHRQDGYGVATGLPPIFDWDAEQPPLGIRDPGRDGVWGATRNTGLLTDRMKGPTNAYGSETAPFAIDQGEVYGPYIEIDDPRLLASTDGTVDGDGRLRVFYPGEGSYDASHPKVIVDYWGNPITYFRRVYPEGAIERSYRAVDRTGNGVPDRVPTLSDVIRLRPFRVQPGSETDVDPFLADAQGDTTTSLGLNAAEFALFSPGPDLRFEAATRFDGEEQVNADNIVEIGP